MINHVLDAVACLVTFGDEVVLSRYTGDRSANETIAEQDVIKLELLL